MLKGAWSKTGDMFGKFASSIAKPMRDQIGKLSPSAVEESRAEPLLTKTPGFLPKAQVSASEAMPTPTKLHPLISYLGLDKHRENKISLFDVNQISPVRTDKSPKDPADIPWAVLRGIYRLDRKARDTPVYESKCTFEGNELNSSDVFYATLSCCSLELRQVLFEKMMMCKLALPKLIPGMTRLNSASSSPTPACMYS